MFIKLEFMCKKKIKFDGLSSSLRLKIAYFVKISLTEARFEKKSDTLFLFCLRAYGKDKKHASKEASQINDWS